MIRPAPALLTILVICTLASVGVAFFPTWVGIFYGLVAFCGGVIFLDLWRLTRFVAPTITRKVNRSLPIGVWRPAELYILNNSNSAQQYTIFDHLPAQFEHTGLPIKLVAQAGKLMQTKYRIKPLIRGNFKFGQVELRVDSPFKLWQRQGFFAEELLVNVYPNFAQLAKNAIKATDTQRPSSGMLKKRRRGQGMDFDQLREYREGDAIRQIDWKASMRLGKMISKEYQDERDQRIILMLDCGRRMQVHELTENEEGQNTALSHFDRALDAVLMLAYIGVHHGDAVGLVTLGGHDKFLAPQRAKTTVNHILNNIYDLQATTQSSDFEQAAQYLLKRERKRALIVLFTNLRDEDDENLLLATRLLSSRHLVLVANLREPELDEVHQTNISGARSAALRAAAAEYKAQRESVFARLRANGVLCLDVLPKDLAVETINRYLSIKSAGAL